jgi:hypothetical protein
MDFILCDFHLWLTGGMVGQERLESLERRGGGAHQQQPGADSDTSDLSPMADTWRSR